MSTTCSAIATRLDEEMLLVSRAAVLYPSHTPLALMPNRSGAAVSAELDGRYLLRYLIRKQYGQLLSVSSDIHFATPTPYSPTEAVSWLALPATARRDYALFFDPAKLSDVRGPRRVRLGGGIEYILTSGFTASALVVAWPLPVL